MAAILSREKWVKPVKHPAITWKIADLLSFRPQKIYFNEILFAIQIFLEKNVFDIIWKMMAYLFQASTW